MNTNIVLDNTWAINYTETTLPSGVTVNNTAQSEGGTKVSNLTTLNLNGHTISYTNSGGSISSASLVTFTGPTGTDSLTVWGGNGSPNASGTITTAANSDFNWNTVTCISGNINFNGLTINGNPGTGNNYAALYIGSGGSEPGYGTGTVNIGDGTVLNAGYGLAASAVTGTVEVNIGTCNISGTTAGIGTNAKSGRNAGYTFNIGSPSGTNPVISGPKDGGVGIYSSNEKNTFYINGGEISGDSGIVIAGGNLYVTGGTISATGDYQSTTGGDIKNNGPVPNGSAIVIQGTAADTTPSGTSYGDVDVKITGGIIDSQNGYAIDQNNGGASTTSTLNTVAVEGGTLNGGGEVEDAPLPDQLVSSTGTIPPYVTGGTFSAPLTGKQLSTSVEYQATGSNGEIAYAQNLTQATQAAQKIGANKIEKITVPSGGGNVTDVTPVTNYASGITVTPEATAIYGLSKQTTLIATVTAPQGFTGDVSWESSDENIVSVNSPTTSINDGTSTVQVTSKAVGTATITAQVSSGATTYATDTAEVTVFGDGITSALPTPNADVIGITLDSDDLLQYYNVSNPPTSNTNLNQNGSFSLSLSGIGTQTNLLGPEQVSWSVSDVSNPKSTQVPGFSGSSWTDQTGPVVEDPNTTTKVYSGTRQLLSSSTYANQWSITYDYVYTVVTPANGSQSTQTLEVSNLSLNYNGGLQGSQIPEGIYELTAKPATGYTYAGYENISDSIRFAVSNSDVYSVRITQNGTDAKSPFRQNLTTNGRSVDFDFIARNNQNQIVTGGDAIWSLGNLTSFVNGSNSSSNYARVNPTTGVVTFLQALPQGVFVPLQLTVDGTAATQILLGTTGSISTADVTGIEPVYETVYANGSTYQLGDNIVSVPGGQYIESSKLTYSTSTPGVQIYNGQVIPNNSNFTGPVTVNVSMKLDDGTTATTSYVVEFGAPEVEADGITAETQLTFYIDDPVVQNVKAALTPANTTEQPLRDAFEYTSANPDVAVVDAFGNVTPIAEGTTTITTSIPSGSGISTAGWTTYTATTTVTVGNGTPALDVTVK